MNTKKADAENNTVVIEPTYINYNPYEYHVPAYFTSDGQLLVTESGAVSPYYIEGDATRVTTAMLVNGSFFNRAAQGSFLKNEDLNMVKLKYRQLLCMAEEVVGRSDLKEELDATNNEKRKAEAVRRAEKRYYKEVESIDVEELGRDPEKTEEFMRSDYYKVHEKDIKLFMAIYYMTERFGEDLHEPISDVNNIDVLTVLFGMGQRHWNHE